MWRLSPSDSLIHIDKKQQNSPRRARCHSLSRSASGPNYE